MGTLKKVTNIYAADEIGAFPSIGAALAAISGEIVHAEEDADHPGCWDIAAADGPWLDLYTFELN